MSSAKRLLPTKLLLLAEHLFSLSQDIFANILVGEHDPVVNDRASATVADEFLRPARR